MCSTIACVSYYIFMKLARLSPERRPVLRVSLQPEASSMIRLIKMALFQSWKKSSCLMPELADEWGWAGEVENNISQNLSVLSFLMPSPCESLTCSETFIWCIAHAILQYINLSGRWQPCNYSRSQMLADKPPMDTIPIKALKIFLLAASTMSKMKIFLFVKPEAKM